MHVLVSRGVARVAVRKLELLQQPACVLGLIQLDCLGLVMRMPRIDSGSPKSFIM